MTNSDHLSGNLSAKHLKALWEITGVMNSSLHFEDVLNNVMDSVMGLLGGQRGFLMVVDDDGELKTRIVKGIDVEEEGYSTTVVGEVVRTRQTLLTNNAQYDERLDAGKSIIIRGLRAILCAPMLSQDRLAGVIYIDTSLRSGAFSQDDAELMTVVANLAGKAIENARLYAVAVEKGRMEHELNMAREIQRSLLPQTLPYIKGYDIAPFWQSARETAGDFYDVFSLSDNHFGTIIADVSDKGAGAALYMAVARTMIRTNAFGGFNAREIVSRTNDLIIDEMDSGMFVTLYHSQFYQDGRSVHINAGHNPPLFYQHHTNTITALPIGGRAVGWFPENPLEQVDIQLRAGDVILYYTDGLTEAENHGGDVYGDDRLTQVFRQHVDLPASDIVARVQADVMAFCDGKPLFDDITLLVIRYDGA
jgi:sigma-B regulation protein RsbU (phosphoserine phosphatase)